jgi:hypothetical protein
MPYVFNYKFKTDKRWSFVELPSDTAPALDVIRAIMAKEGFTRAKCKQDFSLVIDGVLTDTQVLSWRDLLVVHRVPSTRARFEYICLT